LSYLYEKKHRRWGTRFKERKDGDTRVKRGRRRGSSTEETRKKRSHRRSNDERRQEGRKEGRQAGKQAAATWRRHHGKGRRKKEEQI